MTKKHINADIVSGIVFALLGIWFFVDSGNIRQTSLIKFSSAVIPQFAAACLVVLAVLLIAQGVLKMQHYHGDEKRDATLQTRLQGVGLSFALLLLGIALMQVAGFTVGMGIYLILSFLTMDRYAKKNIPVYILVAVAVPIIIFLLFTHVFNLQLPQGVFGIGGGLL